MRREGPGLGGFLPARTAGHGGSRYALTSAGGLDQLDSDAAEVRSDVIG